MFLTFIAGVAFTLSTIMILILLSFLIGRIVESDKDRKFREACECENLSGRKQVFAVERLWISLAIFIASGWYLFDYVNILAK